MNSQWSRSLKATKNASLRHTRAQVSNADDPTRGHCLYRCCLQRSCHLNGKESSRGVLLGVTTPSLSWHSSSCSTSPSPKSEITLDPSLWVPCGSDQLDLWPQDLQEGRQSRTKEGLYLDARSPKRLSGPEEAEEAVRTECRVGEKRKDIRSLLRHPTKGHAPNPWTAVISSRALRDGLAEPLDPRIFICKN